MEQERQTQRRQIIEEERLKLLKLHATKLLGYLPKVKRPHSFFIMHFSSLCHWLILCCFCLQGIFREGDLEHFDEDFKSSFRKSQAGILSNEECGEDEQ